MTDFKWKSGDLVSQRIIASLMQSIILKKKSVKLLPPGVGVIF